MQIMKHDLFDRKPDAVILDLDNTLYAYEPSHRAAMAAARQRACQALGILPTDFDAAFELARKDVKKGLGPTASSHSRLLYFQRMIERLGMRTQVSLTLDLEQTYWRTFLLEVRLRPGAVDFLMDLRAMGITTSILTDLTAQIQFRKIVFLGLESLLDYVVTSEETRGDKETLHPFQLIREKLGLDEGARIWMVGDDHCDLKASEALGAATLFLKTEGRDHGAADAHFTDFNDLRRFVEQWDSSVK